MAESSGWKSDGGRISIVGSSMTSAPSAPRRAANSPAACPAARVTTMRWPKSGNFSNHPSFSKKKKKFYYSNTNQR